MSDALTVAYIALGARKTQQHFDDLPPAMGELEFIDACIQHADMVDSLYTDDFAGIWVYEVAEPFGEEIANAIFANEAYNPMDIAKRLVAAGVAF